MNLNDSFPSNNISMNIINNFHYLKIDDLKTTKNRENLREVMILYKNDSKSYPFNQ